jgi:NDP-sugar pyrophosphorylase family protein
MRAVVLVGGEGTRLRPLTYTTPKPLLPIVNRPFLEHQLSWLAHHGVDEVVLSLGYKPDAFVEHFPGGRFGATRLEYAVEPEPLGTAGAIRFAAGDMSERFLVCNGDVLTDLDITAVVRFHEERGAEATIALTQVDDPSAFGVVPTATDGRVHAFVEKPPRDKAPTNWINAGTYVLEPSMLQRIPRGIPLSIERVTFPNMLEHGGALYAVHSDAYWLDIGTPQKYLEAHRDLLAGRLGHPPIAGANEIAPSVWVQGSATIDPTAHLEGPLVVGEGTQIDAAARVVASVLGPGSRVGRGARVERSVLLAGACVGPEAEAVDAVIGCEARVEERATVAEMSVVGAEAVVGAGIRMAGARVDPPGR